MDKSRHVPDEQEEVLVCISCGTIYNLSDAKCPNPFCMLKGKTREQFEEVLRKNREFRARQHHPSTDPN